MLKDILPGLNKVILSYLILSKLPLRQILALQLHVDITRFGLACQ